MIAGMSAPGSATAWIHRLVARVRERSALARPPARVAERWVAGLALLVMVALPVLEVAGRVVADGAVVGSIDYVRHLTLWVTFLGAGIAAVERRHLVLGFASFLGGSWRRSADRFASTTAAVTAFVLAWASLELVLADRAVVTRVGGLIPQWAVEAIMPIGFALVGIRFLRYAPDGGAWPRALAAIALLAVLAFLPAGSRPALLLPGLALVGLAALAGTPIFVVLGAAASLLFYVDAVPLASIPAEAYRIASNPMLPTIPLFTLAGAILAAGNASVRLARLFQALFGWIPGGTAVAAVLVCAFFTTFNGGSGVTVLALGALMLPILLRQGYPQRFSVGALTASGGLGILLPPSLLIILYGVSAHTPIDRLFLAGIVPGLLMIALFSAYAVHHGWRLADRRARFDRREALAAIRAAKWELLLPIGIVFGIFSGYATLVEVAALAAAYALVTALAIHRDLRPRHDLPRVLVDTAVMIGGIMIILACAMGLTSYLVLADIPQRAVELVQAGIDSRTAFLLALIVFLLLAGMLIDIFSALVVLVPLVLPIAAVYGVDPLHLGIVFLVSMELGYLTPPVGLNLFLASFRFDRPIMEIWIASLPFFLLGLASLLVIAFVPALSTGVAAWLGP